MATCTRENPLGIDYDANLQDRGEWEQRERDRRWCDSIQGVIDAMVNGTIPIDCPWEDKRFQRLVMYALAKGGSYRRDAEKLAVIREVFGSGK